MIRSFRHRGLSRFFNDADPSGIAPSLRIRIQGRLHALQAASDLADLNIPGFDFHPPRSKPKHYSVHVNGPFCITFEWIEGEPWRVDLENYH